MRALKSEQNNLGGSPNYGYFKISMPQKATNYSVSPIPIFIDGSRQSS